MWSHESVHEQTSSHSSSDIGGCRRNFARSPSSYVLLQVVGFAVPIEFQRATSFWHIRYFAIFQRHSCQFIARLSPCHATFRRHTMHHRVVEISWSCTDAPFDIVGLYSIEKMGVFLKTTFAPLLYQSEIGVITGVWGIWENTYCCLDIVLPNRADLRPVALSPCCRVHGSRKFRRLSRL